MDIKRRIERLEAVAPEGEPIGCIVIEIIDQRHGTGFPLDRLKLYSGEIVTREPNESPEAFIERAKARAFSPVPGAVPVLLQIVDQEGT